MNPRRSPAATFLLLVLPALALFLPGLAAPLVAQGSMAEMMEGMTAPQIQEFMEVARKVDCPCGCSLGSLLDCRVKDPSCGTSLRMLRTAVPMIRSGQKAPAVIAALATPPAPKPAPQPTPQPAAKADGPPEIGDAPILGPKDAEVNVVVWSDFQ